MLDYVPMEIVAYADEELPSEAEIYPEIMDKIPILSGSESNTPPGAEYEAAFTDYLARSEYNLQITTQYPEITNGRIMAFRMTSYNGTSTPDQPTKYYVIDAKYIGYKLGDQDVATMTSLGMQNPFQITNDLNGDNFFVILYNLGQSLINQDLINGLVNTEILGMNLLEVIFGSGFLIYVTWVIIKFTIGL